MFFDIKEYKITLTVVSGLYIGGGDSGIRIGGVDNEFIKHPVKKQPYIPGSSLKGKVRSLLEYEAGILPLRCNDEEQKGSSVSSTNGKNSDSKQKEKGLPLSFADYEKSSGKQKEKIKKVLMLFGIAGTDFRPEIGITRLAFSDLELTETYKQNFKQDQSSVFEVKAETAIDRTTGTAKKGSLRFTERVGEGVTFTGTISMKKFADDEKYDLENVLFKGLKLLMMDTLGGAGSRGYGRVKISFDDKDINERFNNPKLS